jgi:hypothetical protein
VKDIAEEKADAFSVKEKEMFKNGLDGGGMAQEGSKETAMDSRPLTLSFFSSAFHDKNHLFYNIK